MAASITEIPNELKIIHLDQIESLRYKFLWTFINIYETTRYNKQLFDKKEYQKKGISLSKHKEIVILNTFNNLMSNCKTRITELLFTLVSLQENPNPKRKYKEKKDMNKIMEEWDSFYDQALKNCKKSISLLELFIGFERFRDTYVLQKHADAFELTRHYKAIFLDKRNRFQKLQDGYLFHYMKLYVSLRIIIRSVEEGNFVLRQRGTIFGRVVAPSSTNGELEEIKKMFDDIKVYLLFLSFYAPTQNANLFEYRDKAFYLNLKDEYNIYTYKLKMMGLPLKGDEMVDVEERRQIFLVSYNNLVIGFRQMADQHDDRELYKTMKQDFENLQIIKEKILFQYKSGIEIVNNIDYPDIFEDAIKRLTLIEIQLQEYRPLDFNYYEKIYPSVQYAINKAMEIYDKYIKETTEKEKEPYYTPSEFPPVEEYGIPGESPITGLSTPESPAFLDFDLALFNIPFPFEPIPVIEEQQQEEEIGLFPQLTFEGLPPTSSSSAPSVLMEYDPEYEQYLEYEQYDPENVQALFYDSDEYEPPPKRRSHGKKKDEMLSLLSFMYEAPRIYTREEMEIFDAHDYNFYLIDKKDSFIVRYAIYNTPCGFVNQIPERIGRSLDIYTSLDPVDDQLVLSLKRGFRISTEYLYRLLSIPKESYPTGISDIVMIDARWKYEYEKGHVKGSINIDLHMAKDIQNILWQDKTPTYPKSTAIILFCQYSHKRSLKLYRKIMKTDINLDYPNLYILEGGYDLFFKHAIYSKDRKEKFFEPTFGYQPEENIGEESDILSSKEWEKLHEKKKKKKPPPKSRLTTRTIPKFDLSGASSSSSFMD